MVLLKPLNLFYTIYIFRLSRNHCVAFLCFCYKIYVFLPKSLLNNKKRHLNILRFLRIHLRINMWTGKVIINWNHHKSMQATIHTMFVIENIIRIYSFCPFSQWNMRHMHFFIGVFWQKIVIPPYDPLKYPTIPPLLLNSLTSPPLTKSEKFLHPPAHPL